MTLGHLYGVLLDMSSSKKMSFSAALLQNVCLFFKSRLINVKQMGRCPLHLERQFHQLLARTAGHSLSRNVDVLSHLLGQVGKDKHLIYFIYLCITI